MLSSNPFSVISNEGVEKVEEELIKIGKNLEEKLRRILEISYAVHFVINIDHHGNLAEAFKVHPELLELFFGGCSFKEGFKALKEGSPVMPKMFPKKTIARFFATFYGVRMHKGQYITILKTLKDIFGVKSTPSKEELLVALSNIRNVISPFQGRIDDQIIKRSLEYSPETSSSNENCLYTVLCSLSSLRFPSKATAIHYTNMTEKYAVATLALSKTVERTVNFSKSSYNEVQEIAPAEIFYYSWILLREFLRRLGQTPPKIKETGMNLEGLSQDLKGELLGRVKDLLDTSFTLLPFRNKYSRLLFLLNLFSERVMKEVAVTFRDFSNSRFEFEELLMPYALDYDYSKLYYLSPKSPYYLLLAALYSLLTLWSDFYPVILEYYGIEGNPWREYLAPVIEEHLKDKKVEKLEILPTLVIDSYEGVNCPRRYTFKPNWSDLSIYTGSSDLERIGISYLKFLQALHLLMYFGMLGAISYAYNVRSLKIRCYSIEEARKRRGELTFAVRFYVPSWFIEVISEWKERN